MNIPFTKPLFIGKPNYLSGDKDIDLDDVESEYEDDESDMDDFIDDGGEEKDVSRHIQSIFGYDRYRYALYLDGIAIVLSSSLNLRVGQGKCFFKTTSRFSPQKNRAPSD